MANLGISLAEQKIQIEALLDLLALAEFQSQGIQLNANSYNDDEFPVGDTSYPDDNVAELSVTAANHLPNQFHFEDAAIAKGLALPLTGNLTFNWYADNKLLGSYSTAEYDYFCVPMARKFRNQRHDFNFDWNFIGNVAQDFFVTLLDWLSDTTFLAHGGYWMSSLGVEEGSVEFALDGSHKVLSKYGHLYHPDSINDKVLFYQKGFLSVETLSTFLDKSNWEFSWWDTYKVSSEGSYTNLLSVGVWHVDYYHTPRTSPFYGTYTIENVLSGWGNTISGSAVADHASMRLVSIGSDNGQVKWSNPNFGNVDPRSSINLRDDASIELHVKDFKETTTTGMPRIFYWGANSAALPADASTVPANGWCIQWDTSFAQFQVFKDGVSQGTGALPALVNGDVDFWINIIAVGATNYEIYFNETLILTVARTYTFSYGAVGMMAYNWDGSTGLIGVCRFISCDMSTIGRLAGGVRKIYYDESNDLLYWVDKHGVLIRYDTTTNGFIKYQPSGATREMWWGISDSLLWIVYSNDTIIEGLNLGTLAVDFSDDRSAEVGFAGYSCFVRSTDSQLIAYEKDTCLDSYDTIDDTTPFVRASVVADFTNLKSILNAINKENPFKQDENGWLRGGRYWHSYSLLHDRYQQSREILWSPNRKNLAILGYHETADNPENDEFCIVLAQEPLGYRQTGRVWSISPVPGRAEPGIQLLGSREYDTTATVLGGISISDIFWDSIITAQKFIHYDANALYRFIFTGFLPNAGTINLFGLFRSQRVNVQVANTVAAYTADGDNINNYNGTGVTGIALVDVWFFMGHGWWNVFSDRTDGITYFHSGAGGQKAITGGSVVWTMGSSGGTGGTSKFELWRYPLKGMGDDNYHMG